MNNKVVEKKLKECFLEIERIDTTLSQFKPLAKEREYLSKYILIYISGVLEISYKTIISNYCLMLSNVNLHNFFESVIIKKSKNATIDNICEILKNVNPELKESFKKKLRDNKHYEEIISAIDSINTLRNSFAHGILTEKVYFKTIVKYYLQAVKMLIILDKLLIVDTNFTDSQSEKPEKKIS